MISHCYILILIFFIKTGLTQPDNLRFDHLTIEDGLSNNNVNCILQDNQGFMWFGTEGGLDKYDGYNFLNYSHDPGDSLTLSYNWVTKIQEDSMGYLWIATQNGLNRLHPVSGKFEHFFHEENNPNSPSANIITDMYIDKENHIWFGTPQGLNKLNIESNNKSLYKFRNYWIDTTKTNSNKNIITAIYEDSEGFLWIGTREGLYSFDQSSEVFTPYLYNPDDPYSISGNHITTIYEDKNNNLWIGTYYVMESGAYNFDRSGLLSRYNKKTNKFIRYERNEDPFYVSYVFSIIEDKSGTLWFGSTNNCGIYKYNEQSGQFIRYGRIPNYTQSLNSNFVNNLYVSKSEILWIATSKGGVNILDFKKEKFINSNRLPGWQNFYKWHDIFKISEDDSGNLWMATWGGGVVIINPKTGNFERLSPKTYNFVRKDPYSICWPWLWDIFDDRDKYIWIGTVSGLDRYNRNTKTFKHFFKNSQNNRDPKFLCDDFVCCVLQDEYNALWIGTNNGLNKMDLNTGIFKHYFSDLNDSTTLSTNFIHCIHEAKSGDLWFGSFGGGLILYDRNKDQFIRYFHDPSDIKSLSDDRVCIITDDKSGNIWIGTMMGLNKFDKATQEFIVYTTNDGLCNNYVVGILEDDHGYLWISTKKGLSKFNPENQTFRNYDISDGLQSYEFNKLSYHKGKSGRFYFGGINGFNIFYPDSVKDNPYIPPVIISSIYISDKPYQIVKPIAKLKEIQLAYDQNIISFDYVALNYTNAQKNQYAYMMNGLDDDWIYCGSRRYARYTSLEPGNYEFRVKASNNDGIWN